MAQPEYDYRVDPLVSEQQVIRSKLIAARAASEAGLRLQVSAPPHELLSNLAEEEVNPNALAAATEEPVASKPKRRMGCPWRRRGDGIGFAGQTGTAGAERNRSRLCP